MPSSTSSSDRSPSSLNWRAPALLIVTVLLVATAFEGGTRAFVFRISNNLGRIKSEADAAAQLQRGPGVHQVLLVGNSLLMADIDIGGLNRGLGSGWKVSRFAIEQTTYYDWHFGLRRLLAGGSRPDAVVLCLEPRHLVAPGVRSELFAYFLLRRGDLLTASKTLGLSPAESSELLFSNLSAFYAMRKEIRKNLIGRIMPSLPELTALITRGGLPPAESKALREVGAQRLRSTREFMIERNVRLVLAVMPPVDRDDANLLRSIGVGVGVPVLAPMEDSSLSRDDYDRDGYHLNSVGRNRFTEALSPPLAAVLNAENALATVAPDSPR